MFNVLLLLTMGVVWRAGGLDERADGLCLPVPDPVPEGVHGQGGPAVHRAQGAPVRGRRRGERQEAAGALLCL